MASDALDILTPQGYLSEIADKPNLDVVMNLFRIPRAFAVSGFGDWNVGQHCFCVAYLALYWARFRGYDEPRRDRLIVLGLTHDLHEAATGDILPALKAGDLRGRLEAVQRRFLDSLRIRIDPELEAELKLLDMIAFLYEIRRAAAQDQEQRQRLSAFYGEQRALLLRYASAQELAGVESFLGQMGLAEPLAW